MSCGSTAGGQNNKPSPGGKLTETKQNANTENVEKIRQLRNLQGETVQLCWNIQKTPTLLSMLANHSRKRIVLLIQIFYFIHLDL